MAASRPTDGSITIAPPADDPSLSAGERFIRQQWRDVADSQTAKLYPDSLNVESSYVTG